MKKLCFITLTLLISLWLPAQQQRLWREDDRKYLVDNLTRTRDLVAKETAGLSEKQWNFKESPDRWSVKQVVEHLGIWELLFDREISMALSAGPQPELLKTARPDSAILGFIMEDNPHITTEYTKPFTYSVPMGLNEGKNNVAWFTKMRNESIEYLKKASEDLRYYYLRPGRPSVHQVYINVFGHTDRHLRQIHKIKSHSGYPK